MFRGQSVYTRLLILLVGLFSIPASATQAAQSSVQTMDIAPKFYISYSAADFEALEATNRDDTRDKMFKQLTDAAQALSGGDQVSPDLLKALESAMMDFDQVNDNHKAVAAQDLQYYLAPLLRTAIAQTREALHLTDAEMKIKLVQPGQKASIRSYGILTITGANTRAYHAQLNLYMKSGEWITLENDSSSDGSLTAAIKDLGFQVIKHFQLNPFESIINAKDGLMEARLAPVSDKETPSIDTVIDLCSKMGDGWRLPFASEILDASAIGGYHHGGLQIDKYDENTNNVGYFVQDMYSEEETSGALCLPGVSSSNQSCLRPASQSDIHVFAMCVKGQVDPMIDLEQRVWTLIYKNEYKVRQGLVKGDDLAKTKLDLAALYEILIFKGTPTAQTRSDASVGHYSCIDEAMAQLANQPAMALPQSEIDALTKNRRQNCLGIPPSPKFQLN